MLIDVLVAIFVCPVQRKYSGPNVEVKNEGDKSGWCVGDIRDRGIPGNNDGTEQREINTEDNLSGKTLSRNNEAIEKSDILLHQIKEKILLNQIYFKPDKHKYV